MPNWVHNEITVRSDDPTVLDRIVASVQGPDDAEAEIPSVFSFQRLVPRPADEQDWYHWNIANWGTKWDASGASVEREPGLVRFTFNTAWSPPTPVINKFLEDAPDTVVKYVWEEEQGFGASFVIDHGTVTDRKDWDIPASHVDIESRGGICSCLDNDEPWFPDCWFERAKTEPGITPRVLEAIRPLAVDWTGTYQELIAAAKELSK